MIPCWRGWSQRQRRKFQDKPEENAPKIWQFKSPKGYALNVMGDSLDITSEFHKTYNNQASDNRFRDIIELVVNSFFEVMGVPTVKRIGLSRLLVIAWW